MPSAGRMVVPGRSAVGMRVDEASSVQRDPAARCGVSLVLGNAETDREVFIFIIRSLILWSAKS